MRLDIVDKAIQKNEAKYLLLGEKEYAMVYPHFDDILNTDVNAVLNSIDVYLEKNNEAKKINDAFLLLTQSPQEIYYLLRYLAAYLEGKYQNMTIRNLHLDLSTLSDSVNKQLLYLDSRIRNEKYLNSYIYVDLYNKILSDFTYFDHTYIGINSYLKERNINPIILKHNIELDNIYDRNTFDVPINNLITIVPLDTIQYIEVIIDPSEKEKYLGTLKDKIREKKDIPTKFLSGRKWFVQHTCLKCRNKIQTSYASANFKPISSLSNYNIQDITFLDEIASIFLRLQRKDRYNSKGELIRDYVPLKSRNLSSFVIDSAFYKCNYCQAKYFMAYFQEYGGDDDRGPVFWKPEYVYIEEIVHVEFDEELFLSLLKKYRR